MPCELICTVCFRTRLLTASVCTKKSMDMQMDSSWNAAHSCSTDWKKKHLSHFLSLTSAWNIFWSVRLKGWDIRLQHSGSQMKMCLELACAKLTATMQRCSGCLPWYCYRVAKVLPTGPSLKTSPHISNIVVSGYGSFNVCLKDFFSWLILKAHLSSTQMKTYHLKLKQAPLLKIKS